MENPKKVIPVQNLDRSKTEEILKEIARLEGLNSGKQELKLKLIATKGDIQNALEVVALVHSTENVDLINVASGDMGPAGAILLAAGRPGTRHALFGTLFLLTEGDPYGADVRASELEDEDKTVYQTLAALTGRRKHILENIKSGKRFSTSTARKCRIIDSTIEVKSKYLHPKSSESESQHSNAGDPETSQNSKERPAESKGADNSAEGRRRGRPSGK